MVETLKVHNFFLNECVFAVRPEMNTMPQHSACSHRPLMGAVIIENRVGVS